MTKPKSLHLATETKTPEIDAERPHPVSTYIQEFIRRHKLKHADLVDPNRLKDHGVAPELALSIDQSYVSRLIDLKATDRPAIGSLSRLLRLITELATAKARQLHKPADSDTIQDSFESWTEFLANRGDTVFYEIARRLGGNTERANLGYLFLDTEDEVQWQRNHVPTQRWIITDVMGENEYDDLLNSTRALIRHPKLERLIYILTSDESTATTDFAYFREHLLHEDGFEELFREKVRCIHMDDTIGMARIRLDDPTISRPESRSGVLSIGGEASPMLIVLPEVSIARITRKLVPIVREAERTIEHGRAGDSPQGKFTTIYPNKDEQS